MDGQNLINYTMNKMKKLIYLSFLLSLLIQPVSATYYQSVFDLKNGTPRQIHQIGSFSGKSVYGGGRYVWVNSPATSVTEILGYIVKSNQTTVGYWQREDAITPEALGADHSQKKLQDDGITQEAANKYWGSQLAYMGKTVDVTKDTWDWLALQMYCYKMSVEFGGVLSGSWTSRPFYIDGYKGIRTAFINDTLSGYNSVTQGYVMAVEDLKVFATNPKKWVFEDPTDDDGIKVNVKRMYKNVIIASNTVAANGGGIQIGWSYNNLLTGCDVANVDTCFGIRFALNTTFIDCNAQYPSKVGFYAGNMNDLTEHASHAVKFYGCRAKLNGNAGEIGFYLHGIDGANIQDCIIEGSTSSTTKGIYFDNYTLNPTTVKTLDVTNLHFEIDGGVPQCALFLKLGGGKVFVNYKGGFVLSTFQNGLIEANTATQGSIIRVSCINDNYYNFKMADKTGGNVFWQFDNVVPPNYTGYASASWDAAGAWCSNVGFTKPVFASKSVGLGSIYPYQSNVTNATYRAWECIIGTKF
jgi:hypothetical protein